MLRVIRTYLNAPDTTMIVDVVDDHNRVVARADRTTLLRDHLNFRTVHILLLDSAGRLILQHLNSSHPRHPNRIGSSAAGYLRAGESYRAAARRKLKAELGIRSGLTYLGEIEVPDEGSRKFVGIFSGKVTQPPTIADPFIAELVVFDRTSLSQLIADSPQSFTPTFIFVYERFRAQRP
jgi:isopentenyl-diphosphate Delta-isomerase